MSTPRASRILACFRSTTSSSTHHSTQYLRPITSTTNSPHITTPCRRQSSKRQLMTESAYRPTSIDPPPPPPRNTGVPSTSIAGDAKGANPADADKSSGLSWTGSRLATPLKRESEFDSKVEVEVSEGEAQVSKPVEQFSSSSTRDKSLSTSESTTPPTPNHQLTPSQTTHQPSPTPTRRRPLRPRKAAMTLTPTATTRLASPLSLPTPKLIRIGVKSKGCSGSAYHLEYVDSPGRFDEVVEQDGVKVLIDSKALMKVIGSEMDWVEDKLSARFVFRNPNVTEQCGCGESFSVG